MNFCSPQAVNLKKFVSNSPCLEIPPSPFLKRLGFGTGVDVFLVERSPKHGQYRSPWAVKKINRRCNGDKRTYMKRLKDEASILKNLAHNNIVGFREFIDHGNGDCALAMEDGEKSLMSMIDERSEHVLGPFPAQQITTVAYHVAQALCYLHHEKFLLHGDLKSANVLIKGDFDSIKLCDFGVALPLDEDLIVTNEDAMYVGTESWTAKEVLQGFTVTNKADIYSYGMILFEMMTLSFPHMHVFPKENSLCGSESYQKAWEEAEEEYQNCLGSRPPLLEYDYDFSYTPVIELFWVCSHESPDQRPSAQQILQLMDSYADLASDPKQKLEF